MARLGDLCCFINGDRGKNYPSQAEISSDGEIPFINAGHIVGGKLDFSDMNYISEEKYNQLNSGKIQENDILYCLRGSLGKKAIVKDIPKGAIASSLVIIRPDIQRLNSDYLFYALESPTVQEQMMQANNGSSQPNLSAKSVSDYTFNLPDIKEQLVIVSKLAKVNELIAMRKEQLAKLDQLVKSRFIELFGDPETNPFKWSISKLSEFCDLQNGYAFKSQDYLDNSTVLNCRMSNIRPDGGFDAEYHPKYLPDIFWEKYKEYRLVDGDVIIAMTDMASDPKILGVPTIVRTNGKKFLLNQRVGKLTFYDNTTINNVYLMFVLSQKHIRQQLVKSAGGSTQINVGKPAVLAVEFFVPPMELQSQFAAFVEQTDKSKLTIQQSLDKLELLKKSLMQQYFG